MDSETPRATARPEARGLRFLLARWLTAHVHVDAAGLAMVRERSRQGAVVYVLRHRSILDAYLASWILRRERLPLPQYFCGLPLGLDERWRLFRAWLRDPHWPSPARRLSRDCEEVVRHVAAGEPVVLFLRARTPWVLATRRESLAAARPGKAILHEVVRLARRTGRPVHLVPLSVFRGRAFRRQIRRLSALAYSVHDAPNDLKKFFTYAFNREDLLVSFGRTTDVQRFLVGCRRMHEARVVRRLGNALQRELAQEERAVWGPLLSSREVLAERVLEGPDVARQVSAIAAERGITEAKAWREARRSFWEMAANFNGFAFGLAEGAFHQVWKRAFSGLEVRGLARVAERVKNHPVVLVPCHRSHFDYLVLSYVFRENFLSPPHIHAGINMAFWPLGPLLRGAGAFFVRRSFAGDKLYKMVFHRYLATLIREGYTLEFFIEGGRSRTGKMLTPKLGVLASIVGAFLQGVRRDLYLVPVSIHYGRIAEENAYDAELGGAAKERESIGGLLRARSVLKQRHGTVYVSFAEPVSLRETLGANFDRFAASEGDAAVEEEQRRFVQKLGFRILRDVNEAAVVGATSLSATVLLSAPDTGVCFADFARDSRALAELLRWRGATFTPSLERNLGRDDFNEILSFLHGTGLIEIEGEGRQRVMRIAKGKRTALDFYKNNSIHFFLTASLVAHALMRGVAREDLEQEVWWWLEIFRWEFPLPEHADVGPRITRILEYFDAHGVGFAGRGASVPLVRALGSILENFREAYWIAARAIGQLGEESVPDAEWMQQIGRSFDAARLLGEVVRPEAANPIVFKNATSRFAEMGLLTIEKGRTSRDQRIRRIVDAPETAAVLRRLGAGLLVPGVEAWPGTPTHVRDAERTASGNTGS
ncbi:MAG: 1-acyl-sn-glycerol-3-phosphate acyltransferase [Deltaproteobacteria bacterium]